MIGYLNFCLFQGGHILPAVLAGRHMSELLKGPDEITAIIKTAFHTDINNRKVGSREQLGRLLYAKVYHIIQRSLHGNFSKKPAKIFRV